MMVLRCCSRKARAVVVFRSLRRSASPRSIPAGVNGPVVQRDRATDPAHVRRKKIEQIAHRQHVTAKAARASATPRSRSIA